MSRSPSPEAPFISAPSDEGERETEPYFSPTPIPQHVSSSSMHKMREEIKAGKGDVQAEQQESSAHRYLMMPEPVEPAKYGFSGTIQQPTPARVFTAEDLLRLKYGNFGYILKRAVKRSSKSAVLKQLAAFARKNKKHANKCLLYKEYIRCI
tara:strand:- start:205 stop:660 length:456 start_codon:yes stop_codon:yes gene_type:complete